MKALHCKGPGNISRVQGCPRRGLLVNGVSQTPHRNAAGHCAAAVGAGPAPQHEKSFGLRAMLRPIPVP